MTPDPITVTECIRAVTTDARPADPAAWTVYRLTQLESDTHESATHDSYGSAGCACADLCGLIGAVLSDVLAGHPLSPGVGEWVGEKVSPTADDADPCPTIEGTPSA